MSEQSSTIGLTFTDEGITYHSSLYEISESELEYDE